jgi:hypothetical protein
MTEKRKTRSKILDWVVLPGCVSVTARQDIQGLHITHDAATATALRCIYISINRLKSLAIVVYINSKASEELPRMLKQPCLGMPVSSPDKC